MVIHKKEIIDQNLQELENYIPEEKPAKKGAAVRSLAQIAEDHIKVVPEAEDDAPEYWVTFHFPMLVGATKSKVDKSFLTSVIKGLSTVAGQLATGNIEGAVINGVTVSTAFIESVYDELALKFKTYNKPWFIPVHVKKDKKYKMDAAIYGDSVVTDQNDWDDDELASISAHLYMCERTAFNLGGHVDSLPNIRSDKDKSNKGEEVSIFGTVRNFIISGETNCDCVPDDRVKLTHVDPSISCQTDGITFGDAISAIGIGTVIVHYVETPCEHQAPKVGEPGSVPKTPAPKPPNKPPDKPVKKPKGAKPAPRGKG